MYTIWHHAGDGKGGGVEKTYFVVSSSDGDVKIDGPMTGPELMSMMRRDYGDVRPECMPVWLDRMPDDLQRMPRNGRVLIQGRIVSTRPVDVVTEYKLP